MRPLNELLRFRRTDKDQDFERQGYVVDRLEGGYFEVPSPIDGKPLYIIASVGLDWDHVSITRGNRCPNWHELEHVKRLFFRDDETAMQLHVPPDDHISVHPTVLHLWRPQNEPIPLPPREMV